MGRSCGSPGSDATTSPCQLGTSCAHSAPGLGQPCEPDIPQCLHASALLLSDPTAKGEGELAESLRAQSACFPGDSYLFLRVDLAQMGKKC